MMGKPNMTYEFQQLEKNIDYEFKEKKHLERAMTRSAYAKEFKDQNPDDVEANASTLTEGCSLPTEPEMEHQEVLCTLGDAVLKLILREHLIDNGAETAAEITQRKQKIEKRTQLAKIARDLGVDNALKKRMSGGEEKQEANKEDNVLGETLEAIIGAIYLDTEYYRTKDVVTGWKGIERRLQMAEKSL